MLCVRREHTRSAAHTLGENEKESERNCNRDRGRLLGISLLLLLPLISLWCSLACSPACLLACSHTPCAATPTASSQHTHTHTQEGVLALDAHTQIHSGASVPRCSIKTACLLILCQVNANIYPWNLFLCVLEIHLIIDFSALLSLLFLLISLSNTTFKHFISLPLSPHPRLFSCFSCYVDAWVCVRGDNDDGCCCRKQEV